MNLFDGDRERHVPGRTPRVTGGQRPATSIKAVTPGFRKRVPQGVKNANFAKHGLRKLFGS